ncbi:hypothetical protein MHI17_30950 [Bacillus sp. FSL L8-0098]
MKGDNMSMLMEKRFSCKCDGDEKDFFMAEQQEFPNHGLIWLTGRQRDEDTGNVSFTCVAITRKEFKEIYESINWDGIEHD